MNQRFHLHTSLLETIADTGSAAETKCQLSLGQSIVLGVIAASYLALATTLSLAMGATIQSPSVQKLVMGAVFPVGLIAVVLAVSELSTGNYLVTPLGAMTGCIHWRHVLYNWAVSYQSNFLGAFLLAIIVIQGAHVLTGAFWGQQWVDLLIKIATTKVHLSPAEAFWRAFLCIWLVDLAIWQSYRVKEPVARFLVIWFPTFAFFALGLEHSVVNMFLIPAAIFAGAEISWAQFLLNNLLPVVMGNVIGGMFIVGMLYWFSAGMPTKVPSTPGKEKPKNNPDIKEGSYSLLGSQLLKGLTIAILFLSLFPGGAAVLGILLPRSWGIFVPVTVLAYLTLMTFILTIPRRREAESI